MKSLRRAWFAPLLAALALGACNDSTGPTLEITTDSLPAGREDQPYSAAVNAAGEGSGEFEWSVVDGFLPAGLALNIEDLSPDEDLLITGTPTREDSFTFTLQVREGTLTATKQFTVVIGPPLVHIENLLLPPALVGAPYDVPLRATGGFEAHEWSIATGALPAGLTLTAEGHIQGTPTATDTVELGIQVTSGDETELVPFVLEVIEERPGFQITPIVVAQGSGAITMHVQAAIDMWEDVLEGDLAATEIPATFFANRQCGGFGIHTNGSTVEDVMVIINIDSIDGPGQVLGQAGPCAIRDAEGVPALTAVGVLTLDSEDLAPLGNTAFYVIAHEIGHVLGLGGLDAWDSLVEGDGTLDPRFIGANAVDEWQALGGTGNVPVEGTGGEGTAGSHWRESTFGSELMTGFISGGTNPLSRVTIGAFEDMGYVVDYTAADPYILPSVLAGAPSDARILGYDLVLQETPRPLRPIRAPILAPQRER